MWFKADIDLLIDFIEARGVSNEQARTVLGVALLAQRDDERLCDRTDALRATSETLDTPLLLDILQTANPIQIAGVLWSPIGLCFSAAQFERLYWIVLQASPADCTLYEVVGAAVDFLRLHPGAFSIPPQIVSQLLQSSHPDWRVVAMKALSHADVPLAYHVDCILQCLKSENESDKEVGLYVLGELIDSNRASLSDLLDPDRVQQLHRALDEFAQDTDESRRTCAALRRGAMGMKKR